MKKMCGSCGMPLKDDVKGTREDGSKSEHYCMYCYENSKFKQPDATVEQMREYSIKGMSEKGWPKFLAKLVTMNMHKLPRWQQADSSEPVE